MKTDETQTLRYRLDTDTYEAIKYQIVPTSDGWNSVSEFTKTSIQNQVKQLISIASGGRQAKKLIRRLSSIDGIDESVPKVATKPKIETETLDKNLSVNLPVEDFGLVNDLVDQTDLNKANVPGYCIFRQISMGDIPRNELDDWYEQEIHRTWYELRDSLVEPQHHLHSILFKRFVDSDMMSYFIQQDLSGFNSFAEVYQKDLYDTDQYENFQNTFASRTFNDVENTIEEYTDYEFGQPAANSEDSDFLEDCLEE